MRVGARGADSEGMKSLVALVSLAAAFAARPAEASSCVLGPYAVIADPPADCPLVYWRYAGNVEHDPRAYVYRDGMKVDVTATATLVGPTELDYTVYTLGCGDEILDESPASATFEVFHVTLGDANVGEQVFINDLSFGFVQAAGGECPVPAYPAPYCVGTVHQEPCGSGDDAGPENDNTAGCRATSGASSVFVGVGVALGALTRRRRRN